MANFMVEDRIISFIVCIIQFFFFCTFVMTESFLLAVMAYDCFVAIWNSLLCRVAMSLRLCATLVVGSFARGTTCFLTFTCSVSKLSFWGYNTINHFFCEFSSFFPSLALILIPTSCCFLFFATFNEVSTLFIILLSHVFYCCHHLQDAFSLWSPQSLLHLCLPPDHHQHLPQHHPLPLLCAQLHNLQAHSQSSVYVLHGGHRHVESPDL